MAYADEVGYRKVIKRGRGVTKAQPALDARRAARKRQKAARKARR